MTSKASSPFVAGMALVVLLLWVLFTDSVKPHELLLGFCVAGLLVILYISIVRTGAVRFRMRPQDLVVLWRVPKAILVDCWILVVVLARDLTGTQVAGSYYRACGFHVGPRDPVLVGRAALAIAYTTASPNMVVIGIDPTQSLMVFHQLKRDDVPVYTQKLGAAGPHRAPGVAASGVSL